MRHRTACASILVAALAGVGCGSSEPTLVPVSGTVEYNGAPVVGASVTFIPTEGSATEGRSANGVTDSSGTFTLTTYEDADGAIPGQYKVTVVAINAPAVDPYEEGSMAMDEVMEPMEDDYGVTESTEIPEMFADPETTTVTATVSDAGETDLNLMLE